MTSDDELFWLRLRAQYESAGDSLVRDGIADPTAYLAAPVRVLFVLREPHGWAGADMGVQLRTGAKYAVWRRIGEWAAGILGGFPEYGQIANRQSQSVALRQIAVINLKKLPGGAAVEWADFEEHVFFTRDALREQIHRIAPSVIVACGTFGPVRWLLADAVDGGSLGERWCQLRGGALVLRSPHPAARGDKKEQYGRLAKTYADAMASIRKRSVDSPG